MKTQRPSEYEYSQFSVICDFFFFLVLGKFHRELSELGVKLNHKMIYM